jgi:FKBP-type peptidyl-prolyl cis-trans isomerase FkpA
MRLSIKTINLAIGLSFTCLCLGATQAEVRQPLKNKLEEQSYSIGVEFGSYLAKSLKQTQESGLDLKRNLVLQGVADSLTGNNLLLSQEKTRVVATTLVQDVRQKLTQIAKARDELTLQQGKQYRDKNAKVVGVKSTDSGLQYRIISQGNGAKPTINDRVKVHYKQTLIDGTEFKTTDQDSMPQETAMVRFRQGLREGLLLMNVGSRYEFTIPPELGYGASSKAEVPANSTLIVEVQLLGIDVAKSAKKGQQDKVNHAAQSALQADTKSVK